jgi:hypothetical protein
MSVLNPTETCLKGHIVSEPTVFPGVSTGDATPLTNEMTTKGVVFHAMRSSSRLMYTTCKDREALSVVVGYTTRLS